ncbi:hypothetical protein BJ322DRAFT_1221299 [Thelephora terrestris]|uniref:Uncharacterized protein n=1 Tax=Thelephora terrestris TaxID=56493 RepID=A0A9P6L2X0_9AGAM|nr:hypothetical protein BJ322DRAFT_1221299 [Thelephora terrestris]
MAGARVASKWDGDARVADGGVKEMRFLVRRVTQPDSKVERPPKKAKPQDSSLLQNDAPNPVGCNSGVVGYIPTVRPAVYQLPRLATGSTEPLPESSKRARNERMRRDAERRLYRELSRYYQLGGNSGEKVWTRLPLLMEVLQNLKVRHPPTGLANAPNP